MSVGLSGRLREGNAGAHFMVGMGETEKEMCSAIQRVKDMGGGTHLFSFYPEGNSLMADQPLPPMETYRRVQLARYLIDQGISRTDRFVYDEAETVRAFGIQADELDGIIDTGEPFRTSGCVGRDGQVACNRPFGNSPPGPDIRNYPFPPTNEDVARIRSQMLRCEGETQCCDPFSPLEGVEKNQFAVIPAKAGIPKLLKPLDSCLGGNDGKVEMLRLSTPSFGEGVSEARAQMQRDSRLRGNDGQEEST